MISIVPPSPAAETFGVGGGGGLFIAGLTDPVDTGKVLRLFCGTIEALDRRWLFVPFMSPRGSQQLAPDDLRSATRPENGSA